MTEKKMNRNILTISDVLYSEKLNCYPPENQAAKIFVQWLKDNPQYKESDVDIRIDSYEREEDYYGNGGGYDRYVRIFKKRQETEEEHNNRIKKEESELFEQFSTKVRQHVSNLIRELSIYPYVVSSEVTAKINEIVETINNDTIKCLNLSTTAKLKA